MRSAGSTHAQLHTHVITRKRHTYGWPVPYNYTVYDLICGEFPAKLSVNTPYIYGSGQP